MYIPCMCRQLATAAALLFLGVACVSMAAMSYSGRVSTVFGKHCECIAQKCTHLERLPPLASQLLLLSL